MTDQTDTPVSEPEAANFFDAVRELLRETRPEGLAMLTGEAQIALLVPLRTALDNLLRAHLSLVGAIPDNVKDAYSRGYTDGFADHHRSTSCASETG
jgi:hypothetical protein